MIESNEEKRFNSPTISLEHTGKYCSRMWATYGVEEVHPCGKNGNFTLQKNNVCCVIENLPLENCVMHIICHYLEGKFFCASCKGYFYTF